MKSSVHSGEVLEAMTRAKVLAALKLLGAKDSAAGQKQAGVEKNVLDPQKSITDASKEVSKGDTTELPEYVNSAADGHISKDKHQDQDQLSQAAQSSASSASMNLTQQVQGFSTQSLMQLYQTPYSQSVSQPNVSNYLQNAYFPQNPYGYVSPYMAYPYAYFPNVYPPNQESTPQNSQMNKDGKQEALPQTIPQEILGALPQIIPPVTQGALPQTLSQETPQTMPQNIPQENQGLPSQNVPQGNQGPPISQSVQETQLQNASHVSQDVSSQKMPELNEAQGAKQVSQSPSLQDAQPKLVSANEVKHINQDVSPQKMPALNEAQGEKQVNQNPSLQDSSQLCENLVPQDAQPKRGSVNDAKQPHETNVSDDESLPSFIDPNMSTSERFMIIEKLVDSIISTEEEASIASKIMKYLSRSLLHYKILKLPSSLDDVLCAAILSGNLEKLESIASKNSPMITLKPEIVSGHGEDKDIPTSTSSGVNLGVVDEIRKFLKQSDSSAVSVNLPDSRKDEMRDYPVMRPEKRPSYPEFPRRLSSERQETDEGGSSNPFSSVNDPSVLSWNRSEAYDTEHDRPSLISSHSRGISPQSRHGRGIPPHGRDIPPYGRDIPPHGRDIPPHGRDIPPHDRDIPAYGRDIPAYGRDIPTYGRDIPTYGRDILPHDRDIPPHSRDIPPHGRDIPPHVRGISPRSRGISPRSRGILPYNRGISPHSRGIFSNEPLRWPNPHQYDPYARW